MDRVCSKLKLEMQVERYKAHSGLTDLHVSLAKSKREDLMVSGWVGLGVRTHLTHCVEDRETS